MENKYSIDTNIEGMVEKKRYTAIEKAKRVLALQGRIDSAKDLLKQDLLEVCADIIAMAKESNSTEVSKFANNIEQKLTKILG